MFKSALESLDSCHGPYGQLNSFQNSNVFSSFLKFCTTVVLQHLSLPDSQTPALTLMLILTLMTLTCFLAINCLGLNLNVTNGFALTTSIRQYVNNTVNYLCERGYKVTGQKELLCQTDGNWNAAAPTCNREYPKDI